MHLSQARYAPVSGRALTSVLEQIDYPYESINQSV